MIYQRLLKPVLFRLDPEVAHHLALDVACLADIPFVQKLARAFLHIEHPCLKVRLFGIEFPNPVGLAAGLDKLCTATSCFDALGFGAIELGSITAHAQPGNPKPRMFRLPIDKAIINRMGFPSDGAEAALSNLQRIFARKIKPRAVLGINLGKTKSAPIDDALNDYLYSFSKLSAYGDYFVLNVSSPNTPELRKLQEKSRLIELFEGVQRVNTSRKPLLVKVSPDLTLDELDDVLDVALQSGVSGLIATNTTLSREGVLTPTIETGGLSGAPLRQRSLQMIRRIRRITEGKLPIIGVGGIFTSDDVVETMKAGADLVQIYTSLVYEGPTLVKRINQGLIAYCQKEGLSSVSELSPSA